MLPCVGFIRGNSFALLLFVTVLLVYLLLVFLITVFALCAICVIKRACEIVPVSLRLLSFD